MNGQRRDFMKTAGIAAITVTGAMAAGKVIADNKNPEALGKLTIHTLPELEYSYDALMPFIDEATMKLHHSVHHKGYVDGLNKAESEIAKARGSADFSQIEYWSKKAVFNGGGHFLHSLFWKSMAPSNLGPLKGVGGVPPTGDLYKKLSEDFGSFETFKKHFQAAASAVEGSGWAILHVRKTDGRLLVLQAENQHKLTSWDTTPILALDVWEHAYYLKYQNKRKDYIEAWWNVVNWEQVQKSYTDLSKA